MPKASLYIHIPFCASFCSYCDFFSVTGFNDEYIDLFLNALISDIKKQIEYFNIDDIPTAYIGGGTPSVLGKKAEALFNALKKMPSFNPLEFTIEANPESADERFLNICREGGVNRLSLGVQTFYEKSRAAVNRIGDAGLLEKKLKLASGFFPEMLSVDLITGLPYQNEKIIADDIKRVTAFNPVHVSLYSLTVEKGTELYNCRKNINLLPDEEKKDNLWLEARDFLEDKGFKQYEVSSFAKEGRECLHNIKYWYMEGWLGAGPGASGTIINEETGRAKRYTYADDIDSYIKEPQIHKAICDELDKDDFIKESLLMGFRYKNGPDKKLFKKRFSCDIEECIPQTLLRWKDKDKMLFLNSFLTDAFLEMEKIKNQSELSS